MQNLHEKVASEVEERTCGRKLATERWNDVPRGTMDEVRSHVGLDLPFV
jgi:hypothetical protein